MTDSSLPATATDHARRQRLLDVYGAVLTERQRLACRLHLDEDWSVTELAEHLGCSRAGAHDLLRRGIAQMEHLEARLGLAGELAARDAAIDALRRQVGDRVVTV